MEFSFKVTGLDTLVHNLATLGQRVHNRVMKGALTAGAKPIWMGARRLLRTGRAGWEPTLATKRSLGVALRSYRSRIVAVIGPRRGHRVFVGRAKYPYHDPANLAHLVERGHGGPAPAPEHPFLGPAFESAKSQAGQIIKNRIAAGIAKEAAKK